MKKITMLLGVVFAVVLLLGTSSIASAQATRTWVSGVGDDVNPCSRTAPCKTFAGAISKTAPGGEINVLDPGGYGAVTITKAIIIDGGGSFASILNSGTNGVVVNAAATDVVILRNLSINGAGTGLNGIRFIAGGSLYVENVLIQRNAGLGIDFEPAATSQLFVSDTTVQNNVGGGILVKPGAAGTAKASLVRVQMLQNLYGVRVEDRSNVTINESVASHNANNGFFSISAAAPLNMFIENSVASHNPNVGGGGINSQGAGSTIRISNVVTTDNGNGMIAPGGGQILSFGNNKNAGNVTNGAPTGSAGALQ